MSSHLTTLGFLVTTEQDFRHYVYQASEFGQKIVSEHGSYTLWKPGGGIELWAQANVHKRLLGMKPHFSGKAKMRVHLTMRIPHYEQSRLDGAFHGWVEGCASEHRYQPFPLVFDLPDYDTYHELELPTISMVQLTAFAYYLTGYASEAAYRAAEHDGTTCSLVESFRLVGSPLAKHKSREPVQARAMISGHVLATQTITNPVTSQKFYWARIHTQGGELDMVADPQVVRGQLVTDGVLYGSFWLSGRLL